MTALVATAGTGSCIVLTLEDRVGETDLPALREALSSVVAAMAPSADLIVDVSAVTSLDDLGAAVLRSAIVRARWNRNSVAVVADPASTAAAVMGGAVHAPGVGVFEDLDSAVRALDAHRAAHAGQGARAVDRLGAPANGVANPFRSNLS